jgi:hypothetical protein
MGSPTLQDTSRSNLASAAGLLSRRRLSKPDGDGDDHGARAREASRTVPLLKLFSGGCSGQRVCQHAQLEAPRHGAAKCLGHHQLSQGSSTQSHTGQWGGHLYGSMRRHRFCSISVEYSALRCVWMMGSLPSCSLYVLSASCVSRPPEDTMHAQLGQGAGIDRLLSLGDVAVSVRCTVFPFASQKVRNSFRPPSSLARSRNHTHVQR